MILLICKLSATTRMALLKVLYFILVFLTKFIKFGLSNSSCLLVYKIYSS